MQKVKICGITSLEDAMLAIQAGADALGFVFYPHSPRFIAPEEAGKIIHELPPFVEKVGLFVNSDAQTINQASALSGITLVQLHFETDSALKVQLDLPYIQVIRAQSKKDIETLDPHHYYLVDAFCESYGGSGKRLNLEWFDGMDCSRIIIAGGLTPENVSQTLPYCFYGVDVSSGTESSKGKKDPHKVRSFIKAAKSC